MLTARPDETVLLRDGGSILVRAIAPSDKPLLVDLFRHLGPVSVRHRFFGAKNGLGEKELVYFTELDFVSHVAFVAILRENGVERMIGVGRYCRVRVQGTAPPSAEIAFTVVDEHQGRGIGTILLERIARVARDAGVEQLVAEVMGDNWQMMQVFHDSGFVVQESLEEGIYHVTFPTNATDAFTRASAARNRMVHGMRGGAPSA